ncbi:copper-translocating P-type ATPase [Anaerosphaera multitolerans]|uniref:P-type Cu(+) transporter n=2 Tax=Anaerosphaera multitolerans TaxID=2487351 RepID=A0A437S7W2_9FIRM|nr:copper-translocating P-type ATPase [Anaerosphaera multitolerans]
MEEKEVEHRGRYENLQRDSEYSSSTMEEKSSMDMEHMNHVHKKTHKTDRDGHHISHMDEDSSMDKHSHMDHSNMEHSGHMEHMGNLKQKFFISLIFAIPILLLSPMMGISLPFQFTFRGSQWVVLILSTIIFFYGGRPFLKGAQKELKDRSPAMMTLISLGITTSYIYSVYAFVSNNFFPGKEHIMDFFWELATLILIMLLGHWIEMKAVSGAGDALKSMAKLLPAQASVEQEDGSFQKVDIEKLKVDQVVMVKSGEKIPADGIILEGSSNVNEAMLTGESKEVSKKEGDSVIGGSLNGAGSIKVKVTGTGETGYLAQVMQLVGDAQKAKSKAETMSDKVARYLFYIALIVGIISFGVWYAVTGDLNVGVTRMVTVFVIACPHALGLAIPLVVARSTSLGAQRGLLLRNRQALETATKVDVVMMDKTGTLTEGNFKVKEVVSFSDDYSSDEVLSIMAALEEGSSHPLGISTVSEAKSRNLKIPRAKEINNLAGVGLEGRLSEGKDVKIVTANYLEKNKYNYDKDYYREISSKGYSISFLILEEEVLGLIAQGDEIKSESKILIEKLKSKGIKPVMLTGDNEAAASKVADLLNIEDFKFSLLPEDKEKLVSQYEKEGKVTMMVGDGVNDAPSLARANVGVAIGAGTDVAIDAADVILVKSNPSDILHFLSLAENTTRKMVQNLWWGAGYNIVAIPLASGILAPFNIILSPAVGAILMSLSTVIVAINALSLNIKE